MAEAKTKAPAATAAGKAEPKLGKSLQDFRAEHDKSYIVPKRIKDALEKLGDGWEYEVHFLRLAGLSVTDLAAYRDQFEAHIVVVGGRNSKRIWVGTSKLAAQMREMVS